MTWRGPRTPRDPWLATPAYRAARRYWIQLGLPCALCRRPINYDAPWLLPNGRRNPWAYQLDHITARAEAHRLGWTDTQINAISNTRPVHARCNHLAGIKLGHRTHKRKAQRRKTVANTSRIW